MTAQPSADDVNRNQYRRATTVNIIKSRNGNWIDRSERLIINEIADEIRSQTILDIGVGTGRTTWLLRPLSADYIAIDLSPEMVEVCRHEHPGLDVRECDVRDLSAFNNDSFKLVFFSFNGIDLLGHDDRLRAMKEMHRVLQPGGLLLYSTSNKNGKLYGIHPWDAVEHKNRNILRILLRFSLSISRYWRIYRNWWQKRSYAEDHGAWAIRTSRAYEFGVIHHWTHPSTELQSLNSAGFNHCEFRSSSGNSVVDDSTQCSYFYVLARK